MEYCIAIRSDKYVSVQKNVLEKRGYSICNIPLSEIYIMCIAKTLKGYLSNFWVMGLWETYFFLLFLIISRFLK